MIATSLISNCFVRGHGITDIRVRGEQIEQIAPRLRRHPGEELLDAGGGEVLPGLHDHHVHLLASAAAAGSLPLGPPDISTAEAFDAALAAADRDAAGGAWIRGVGYHQSVAGELDAARIDAVVGARPVRIQHRGGALWVLNSPGLAAIGPVRDMPPGMELDEAGRPTGRFWRLDSWLGSRLPRDVPDLSCVSRVAAAHGITGFTDATPHADPASLELLVQAHRDGILVQRLHLMTGPGLAPPAEIRPATGISAGAVKILLDDVDLPGLDGLVGTVRTAHRQGRPVAFHCVTRAQAVVACATIAEAGPRADRIEHGSVMDMALADMARTLGITVVTQPAFVRTRGDRYLEDVDAEDLPDLWRLASLIESGVPLAAGTDAPFGPIDPWVAIEAATDRRTEGGQPLGPDEAISPEVAYRLFTGHPTSPARPRKPDPGGPADLCILSDRLPATAPFPPTRATMVGGRIVYPAR